jgi:predicted MFS family arabinose efflux permease
MATRTDPAPRELLRDHDVRVIWLTRIVSEIGSRITREGLPVTAVLTTAATAPQMGLLAALPNLPALFLAPLAALVVDRTARRPLMITIDLLRALLLLSIPAAWLLHRLGFLQVLVVTALVAGLSTVFQMADQAYLPFLVGRDRVAAGNSLMGTADAVGETVGPMLMGILVQGLGAPLAILVDAVSYLVSAGGLRRVRRQEPPPAAQVHAGRFRDDVLAGIRLVRAHALLRRLGAAALVGSAFGGIFSTLYEIYVFRVLHLSALDLGILVTTGGLGALAAATWGSRLLARHPIGQVLAASLVVEAIANVLIPLAPASRLLAFLALLGAQVIGDGAGTVYQIAATSIQQRLVDDARQGRVAGAMQVLGQTAGMVGALVAGLVAVAIGVRTTLYMMPVGSLLAAGLFVGPLMRDSGRVHDLMPLP